MYVSHSAPSKATRTTIEAILFSSTKENRLLRRSLLKKERQTSFFKSDFPCVFATYHYDGPRALQQLWGVPAKDQNQVFNEPLIFLHLSQVWMLLMPSVGRVTTGPTQSIKSSTYFSLRGPHNGALCRDFFSPLLLCWHQSRLNERIMPT